MDKLISFVLIVFICCICTGGNSPFAAGEIPALKTVFKEDFVVGAALNRRQVNEADPMATAFISRQFNTVTPENDMKAALIHPEWGRYNFVEADKLIAFGQRHHMQVNAHTLIWHSQLPAFVMQLRDKDSLKRFFKDHISVIASRYDGKVYSWDVVNEALNEDGTMRKSLFQINLGDDYVVQAFQLAGQAAPHTKLYYNDYNIERPGKRAGAVALIRKIQAAGARIDGVGIQGHWHVGKVPLQDIEASILAFSALGIDVMFTELDISVLPDPKGVLGADVNQQKVYNSELNPYAGSLPDSVQQQLARDYEDLFRLFLKYKKEIGRVTFWGVNDGDSWLNNWPVTGRTNYPLLFDRQFNPKMAFDKVIAIKTDTVTK
jgi:endo-1,4-beta-xylanase